MEPNEIMNRLNEITKAELELNWNLSEIKRAILNDSNKDAKHVVLARQLEDELNRDIRQGYVAKVGFLGTLTVYEKKDDDTLLQVKRIESENLRKLPYGYVMGRKLPKYAYLETLNSMK